MIDETIEGYTGPSTPAPEITEDWIREKITKSYNPAKAIHSAIAEQLLLIQEVNRISQILERENKQLKEQLAAKEKEVERLKGLIESQTRRFFRELWLNSTGTDNLPQDKYIEKHWQEFKQQHKL